MPGLLESNQQNIELVFGTSDLAAIKSLFFALANQSSFETPLGEIKTTEITPDNLANAIMVHAAFILNAYPDMSDEELLANAQEFFTAAALLDTPEIDIVQERRNILGLVARRLTAVLAATMSEPKFPATFDN